MNVNHYLEFLVERGGSDLHLKAGGPGYVRVDGDLKPITTLPQLSPADTERFAFAMMDDRVAQHFLDHREADFAYSLSGVGRFRVNVVRQRGSVGLVMRRVLPGAPEFESLGLPAAVRKLSEEHRGLVLVTGPTGSGKTTTTAAMIGHVNRTRRCHIVSIEDPIEVIHRDELAIVDQREVGVDTADFATALKHVARQDPDVIFIGEMRDIETVMAALQAAETGHFVISTLHTTDAKETVNRVIDFFPPFEQKQVRLGLATSLRGVVCQRLMPRADEQGRAVVMEIAVNSPRLAEAIADPDRTDTIEDIIADGAYSGMQTFDQHLLRLVLDGTVTIRAAKLASSNTHDFSVMLKRAGVDPVLVDAEEA